MEAEARKDVCGGDGEELVEGTLEPAKNIKAIDRSAVHRICSGQVVLTLATAVKELVENSLDAGATSVEVRLKDHGATLVEVLDNGSGVDEADFEGLTLKHHTSKLRDFEGLEGVSTFGFRGEALSSLCALGDVTITTRHTTAPVATRLTFAHSGVITERIHTARQVGTTVCVQGLFSTLPVRYKEFQRNIKREFNKMVHVLYSYCLISTGVRIACTNQTEKGKKTTIVSTSGHPTVKDNISAIFGAKQASTLLELRQSRASEEALSEFGLSNLADTSQDLVLEGWVSSCAHGLGRPSPDRQFYFVNSRPCDPPKVSKVMNEVYRQYNRHQSPCVVLNLRLGQSLVDVNLTPDKRQILLAPERLILATVKTSLIRLYENIPSTYNVNNSPLATLTPRPAQPTPSPSTTTTPKLSALTQRFGRNSTTSPGQDLSPLALKRPLSDTPKAPVNKQPKLMSFFKRNFSETKKPESDNSLTSATHGIEGTASQTGHNTQDTQDTGKEVDGTEISGADSLCLMEAEIEEEVKDLDVFGSNDTPDSISGLCSGVDDASVEVNGTLVNSSFVNEDGDVNSSFVNEDGSFLNEDNCVNSSFVNEDSGVNSSFVNEDSGVINSHVKEDGKISGDAIIADSEPNSQLDVKHDTRKLSESRLENGCLDTHTHNSVMGSGAKGLLSRFASSSSLSSNSSTSDAKATNGTTGSGTKGLLSRFASSSSLQSYTTSSPNCKRAHSATSDFLNSLASKRSKVTNKTTEGSPSSQSVNLRLDSSQSASEDGVEVMYEKIGLTASSGMEHSGENDVLSGNDSVQDPTDGNKKKVILCEEYNAGEFTESRRCKRVEFDIETLKTKLSQTKERRREGGDPRRRFRAKISPSDNTAAEDELKREISKEMFGEMEVLGQFNLGFILARLGSDLFIIDQHATDEKYNFETLQRTCILNTQRSVVPQRLELTAANEAILLENMPIFRKNGFEFCVDEERPAGRRVSIVSKPYSRGWEFGKDDVEELLFLLSEAPGVDCRPSRVRAMFASRACRSAVMIGTALTNRQMTRLLRHMGEMEHPWNCPHGRPTMRHLLCLDMIASPT